MWLDIWPEDNGLRLKWGNHKGPHPPVYSIGPRTLREACETVGHRLAALTEWAATREPDQLPMKLRRLAEAGAKLHWALFDPPMVNGTQIDLAPLKQWINDEREGGDTELVINAHPDLHVPWGLVFEEDCHAIRTEAVSLSDFQGFWALRLTLAATFSGCNLSSTREQRRRESFRLLSLINRHEYAHAPVVLGARYAAFTRRIGHPVGAAFNVRTGEKKIDEAAKKDTIFHFFGHCRNGRLDLGDDDTIDVIDFKKMMKRLTERDDGRGSPDAAWSFSTHVTAT